MVLEHKKIKIHKKHIHDLGTLKVHDVCEGISAPSRSSYAILAYQYHNRLCLLGFS